MAALSATKIHTHRGRVFFSFNTVALIATAMLLSLGAGSAYAATTVSISGTTPKTLGGMEGANIRLHVPLQRKLSITDDTPIGEIFGAGAKGNTVTLTLDNGAEWTALANSEFRATNVAFRDSIGTTTCTVDFGAPIWNVVAPEKITFTVAGCSDGTLHTSLEIDFATLAGTVIDLSGAGAGNVTVTVGGTVFGIAGDVAPALVEVLAEPGMTATTGATSTYTPGTSHPLPTVSLIENAVGALGCSAGATSTPGGATITLTLPAGVLFDSNVDPSIATTDPQYDVMTLDSASPSINRNYFFVPCTTPSMDSASSPDNVYLPATINLLGDVPPSVSIPANFTGDLKATLHYKLGDGTTTGTQVVLAKGPLLPPAATAIPLFAPWHLALLALGVATLGFVLRRKA